MDGRREDGCGASNLPRRSARRFGDPPTLCEWPPGRARRFDRDPRRSGAHAHGYTTRDATFARWRNPGDVEFVFTGGDYGAYNYAAPQPFTEAVCPLDHVAHADGATEIALNPICNDIAAKWGGWRWYADGAYPDFGRPTRVENAYELLALPGQWYLDRTGAVAADGKRAIYYVPRAGEDMTRAEVIAPVLETLVEGRARRTSVCGA